MACPIYWKMCSIYISVVDIHFYQACPYAGLVCMLDIYIKDSLALLAKFFKLHKIITSLQLRSMTFLTIHET